MADEEKKAKKSKEPKESKIFKEPKDSKESKDRTRLSLILAILLFLGCLVIFIAGLAWRFFFSPTTGSIGIVASGSGAILLEVEGRVKVKQPNSSSFVDGENGMILREGAQVVTEINGRAKIEFNEDHYSRMGPNTIFIFNSVGEQSGDFFANISLEIGEIWLIIKGGTIDVDTEVGLASVRGSYMSVSVDPVTGTERLTCLEGTCVVSNQAGSVQLGIGEIGIMLNSIIAPTPYCMSHSDVSVWLSVNPEATEVILTVTAGSPLCAGGPIVTNESGEYITSTSVGAQETNAAETATIDPDGTLTPDAKSTGKSGGTPTVTGFPTETATPGFTLP